MKHAEFMLINFPTFYEIKAEVLPPFGEKTRKIFMLEKNSNLLSAGDYFFPF